MRLRAELGFELDEVDVTGVPELQARYRELLPVVEIDGTGSGSTRRSRRTPRGLAEAVRPARLRGALGRMGGDVTGRVNGLVWRIDRVTAGVAARLCGYLQVLTQARKMGKERISSQEISDYTNINATQIRRDLSAFGKFGKRGVGYDIDSPARRDPEDPPHAGPAQHRAVGAGRSARRSRARRSSREHGINIAASSTSTRARSAAVGRIAVTDYGGLPDVVRDKNIIVGVLAVPAEAPRTPPTTSSAPACGSSSTTPRRCSTCPPTSTVHTSTRRSSCSTRWTST